VIVEFKNADRSICKGLFKVFYPLKGAFPIEYACREDEAKMSQVAEKEAALLDEAILDELAEEFANVVPEGEFSAAQIQGKFLGFSVATGPYHSATGLLMCHKRYPGEAVDVAKSWVEEKRGERKG
jgi:hypothetical protein